MLWRLSPGQSKRLLIDAPSYHVRDRVRESALVLRSTPMAAISGQIAVYNVLRSTETVLATHNWWTPMPVRSKNSICLNSIKMRDCYLVRRRWCELDVTRRYIALKIALKVVLTPFTSVRR